MLEKPGQAPLYMQLRERIRIKIEEGEYAPGTAIPSEAQLAESSGLTRLSVRNAVDALVQEGILTRVHGKGVFVRGPKIRRDLETLGGYRHMMQEKGADAETKVLIKACRHAGPLYSILLGVAPEDMIWYIRRTDYADGNPLAVEDIFIPYALMPWLEDVDMSLFTLYDAMVWNGIQPRTGRQRLGIAKLDPSLAKLIDLQPGQAVMQFDCQVFDSEGRIIEFSRCYSRGDRTDYLVHFEKKEKG